MSDSIHGQRDPITPAMTEGDPLGRQECTSAPTTDDGPWTTERIREAFIYDGGEAEYHDPINGARERRRVMGAIFDAWLTAHDLETMRLAYPREHES